MAYIVANKDGTSNGRPGDTVITGGGLVHIGADGSKTVTPLPGVGKTKNYDTLKEIANNLTKPSWLGGGGNDVGSGSGSSGRVDTPFYKAPEKVTVNTVDDNGIASVSVDGYSPVDYGYGYSSSSGSSSGLNKIGGAIILGLIGLAILDRFVGGKGK